MKNKHFTKALCIILAIMLLLTAIPMLQTEAATDALQLYVATDGDDSAAGTSLDAPLKTLEGARDKIRAMKASGTYPAAGVVVNIRGGEYLRLGDSFTLDEQDSGTAEGPVIYRAYNNEKVVFSGGLEVDGSNFVPVTDEAVLARLNEDVRDDVLVYDIGAVHGITEFAPYPKNGRAWSSKVNCFELAVDGELQTLSRYPNTSMLRASSVVSGGYVPRDHVPAVDGLCVKCSNEQGVDVPEHSEAFFLQQEGGVFKTNDSYLNAKYDLLKQETELWSFGYYVYEWAEDRCTVEEITQSGSELTITLGEPSYYGVSGNPSFYLFNALCEVDAPGEYYLDRENAKLYYYPANDLANSNVSFLMQSNDLVVMNGADYVQWQNISFANGNANAMRINGADYVEIAGCDFENFLKTAISISGSNNTVRSCNIANMGADGVSITGGDKYTLTPGNNLVINCEISNVAMISRTGARAIQLSGCGNSAMNNLIYDLPEIAIFFRGVNITIAGNEIYDVCKEATDTGAIYCGRAWADCRGSLITNNYVHDIPRASSGRSAVYLDDMVSGITVTNNLFVNLPNMSAQIGGGRDIVYTNNILLNEGVGGQIAFDERGLNWAWYHAAGPNGELVREVRELMSNAAFDEEAWREAFPEVFEIDMEYYERNSQYGGSYGEGYEEWYKNAATPENAVITNNIAVDAPGVYSGIASTASANGTVENNESYDAGTDIGFTDAENGDFTVKAESAIKTLMGNEHFDAATCGLYRDEFRTTLPGDPEVTLETSKSAYAANENVPVTLTVANPTLVALKSIRTEIHLPEGLQLVSGSLTQQSFNLAAGESVDNQIVVSLIQTTPEPTTEPTTVPTTAPTTAPTTEPTTAPTTAPTTESTEPDAPVTKVEVTDGGITSVPESLKDAGLDTVEEVKTEIVKAIIAQNKNVEQKNVAHYDVTLMYTEDGGKTWIRADETHFPDNGKLTVTIPYPAGTNSNYTFTVAHMFTSTAFGKTPGDVETPKVTNTKDGIQFEVTGLSPISVGWTAPANPQTGDTAEPIVWLTLVLVSAAGIAFLFFKNQKAAKRMMSLLLVFALAASMVIPAVPAKAVAEGEEEAEEVKLTVSTNVVIGGKNYTITADVYFEAPTVDKKAALREVIAEAAALKAAAVVGEEPGQWSQDAVDALDAAITAAQAVLDESAAGTEQLFAATAALNSAISTFRGSQIRAPYVYHHDFETTEGLEPLLGSVAVSGEKYYTGQYSYKVDEDREVIQISLPETQTENVVTLMFYDTMTPGGVAAAAIDGNYYIGLNSDITTNHYGIMNGTGEQRGVWFATDVERSEGWHELKWDFTNGTSCVAYIDGVRVGEFAGVVSYSSIRIGDWWTDNKVGDMYFDDFKVWWPDSVDQSTQLQAAIAEAAALVAGATVGSQPGQWSQTAVDALSAAIVSAQAVLDDEQATMDQVNAAVTALEEAIEVFNDSKIRSGVVYHHDFETEEGLVIGYGTITLSDEQKTSGNLSLKMDEARDVFLINLDKTQVGGVATMMFYDSMKTNGHACAALDGTHYIGLNSSLTDKTKYGYTIGGEWISSDVERSEGWHEFRWDLTDGENCVMYIDGKYIATIEGITTFGKIAFGDWWGETNNADNISGMYFDDFVIALPADKTELQAAVNAAEEVLNGAADSIGPDVGQWGQSSVDALTAAVKAAKDAINDVKLDDEQVAAAVAALEEAVETFENSKNKGAVLYHHDFETEEGLAIGYGTVTLSDEQKTSGNLSLKLDEARDVFVIILEKTQVGGVATIMFYDNMKEYGHACAALDGNYYIGLNSSLTDKTHYGYSMGSSDLQSTDVERSLGWHEFRWDMTDGENCVMYIDGQYIGTAEGVTTFGRIAFGDWWNDNMQEAANADNISGMYFDDFKIIEPVDRADLQAAVNAAEEVLSGAAENIGPNVGQWSEETVDAFEAAIADAKTVLNNLEATRGRIEAAVAALEEAVEAFENGKNTEAAIDKTALQNAITAATDKKNAAVPGEAEGNYAQADIDALATAITTAEGVMADEEATLDDIYAAVTALNDAVALFESKVVHVDKTALQTAITAAATLKEGSAQGTEPGQWSEEAHTTFAAAIAAAQDVADSAAATQAAVDAAVTALEAAVEAFENSKIQANKEALQTAVTDAEGLLDSAVVGSAAGEWLQEDYDTFADAVEAAKAVLNNDDADQAAVEAAVEALTAAVETFNASKIASPVLYHYDFEDDSALVNLSLGTPSLSDTQKVSGSYSFVTDDGRDVADVMIPEEALSGKVVTIMFYDSMKAGVCGAAALDGNYYIGVSTDIKTNHYGINQAGNKNASDYNVWTTNQAVERKEGWHELKWELTDGKCVAYVDGIKVGEFAGVTSFTKLRFGDWWIETNVSDMYFDDLKVIDPADNSQLKTAVEEAKTLLSGAQVGVASGNWSQAAVDAFDAAVKAAEDVVKDLEATEYQIADAVAALAAAQDAFENRQIVGTVVYYYDFEDPSFVVGFGEQYGTPSFTENQAVSGTHSFVTDQARDIAKVDIPVEAQSGKVVTIMFYDTMAMGGSKAAAALQGNYYIGLNGDNTYYSFANGGDWQLTGVERSEGWHELKWDLTNGTSCVLYIDGVQVGVIENAAVTYDHIRIGDWWNDTNLAGNISNMYFDDLMVINVGA